MMSKFGETKGPFIVWLFVGGYFAIHNMFSGRSSGGTLPQYLTVPLLLNLLISIVRSYGVILVFLVVFLAVWERRRSLRDIFSSVGLKRMGTVKSVLWSVALFPLMIVVGLISIALSYFLGPVPFLSAYASNGEQLPLWYSFYMIINSFFPVAVVEEMWARGYMLDRLMPQHPSGLVKALPAILLSSLLFTLWHVPSYLRAYAFSIPWVVGLLAGNVFPISIILSIAYVRAKTRNTIGPVFIHFLLDSMPIMLTLLSP